jgi:tetratricopeptide (TPR) repeat protein
VASGTPTELVRRLLDGDPEAPALVEHMAALDPHGAVTVAEELAEALDGTDGAAEGALSKPDAAVTLIESAIRGAAPEVAVRLSDAVLVRHPNHPGVLSLRGQAHAALQEWDPAIADYRASLEADDSSAEVWNFLGVAYELSGRPREALEIYEKVIGMRPDVPLGYRNRGDAHIALGEAAEAEADYTASLTLQPDPDVLLYRARSRVEQNRLEEAAEDLDASAQAAPPTLDRLQLRGYVLLLKGDRHASRGQADLATRCYREAQEAFGAILDAEPERAMALLGRAKARRVLGDVDGAVADFTEAGRLDPRDVEIAMERGLVLEAQGRYEEALAAYEDAVQRDPENPLAYRYRGGAHALLERFREAERDYTRALELAPKFVDARLARAATRMLGGDVEGALQDLDETILQDPVNVPARSVRARLLVQRAETQLEGEETEAAADSFRLAVADFDEQVRLAPNPQTYTDRATILGRMGETDRAAEDFTAALDLDPTFAAAISGRGIVREIQGRYEDALEDYRRAAELEPSSATNHLNLGDAHAGLIRWEEAVRDYTKAIELDPKQAQAYLGRGKALAGQGEHRRALQDFDAFLALMPDSVDGYVVRGDALRQLSELDRALGDYGRALQHDPGNRGAHRGRILTAIAQSDDFSNRGLTADAEEASERAIGFCDEAVSGNATDPALYRYRALALWRLEAFDEAVEDLEAALERTDPEDDTWIGIMRAERAEALRLWGKSCGLEEKVREALAGFEEALAILPPSSDRMWILEAQGEALAHVRDERAALAAYEASLQASPGRVEALQGVGVMRHALGEAEAAREAFQAVLDASDGTDPTPRVGLGLALQALEQTEEAEAAMRAALAGEAEVDAYTKRANAFDVFRLPERALSDRVQAVLSSPRSPMAHNELAWHYVEHAPEPQLRWEAVLHAAVAVDLDEGSPSRASLLDTLGWAHFLVDDAESAAKYLEQAIELSSRPVVLRHHLERVREALSASPAGTRS